MKVVHLNNFDIKGGAAKACYSIHKSLINLGIDSKILSQFKYSNDVNVISFDSNFIQKSLSNLRSIIDTLEIRLLTNNSFGKFSFGDVGIDITKSKIIHEADIIHLHWINNGFLSMDSLKKLKILSKPIVWTLHDMWAFTGGCHYNLNCERYLRECNYCPNLKRKKNDSSFKNFHNKSFIYSDLNLSIVTCSKWLGECAKSSVLLANKEIQTIPNPIDTNIYKPINKEIAKQRFGLNSNKKYFLFGTMTVKDERKGFHLLKKALIELGKDKSLLEAWEVIVFGRSNDDELVDIPFKVSKLGRLSSEEDIALAYNCGEIFIAPSIQDNLPNTVMEALACGTPVVAFNIGGMKDMISHNVNGRLVNELSYQALAKNITELALNLNTDCQISAVDSVVNKFSPRRIGMLYKQLYEKLIG